MGAFPLLSATPGRETQPLLRGGPCSAALARVTPASIRLRQICLQRLSHRRQKLSIDERSGVFHNPLKKSSSPGTEPSPTVTAMNTAADPTVALSERAARQAEVVQALSLIHI